MELTAGFIKRPTIAQSRDVEHLQLARLHRRAKPYLNT